MTNLVDSSGAEVAIPVLAESQESAIDPEAKSPFQHVPTIAVTKANTTKPHPALPIDVPDQDTYGTLPSPAEFQSTSPSADLKAADGPGIDMRELPSSSRHIRQPPLIAPIPPPKSTKMVDRPVDLLVQLDEPPISTVPVIEPIAVTASITDLPSPIIINDNVKAVEHEPSPSLVDGSLNADSPGSATATSGTPHIDANIPAHDSHSHAPAEEEDRVEKATTIRLIGDGGIGGVVDDGVADEPVQSETERAVSKLDADGADKDKKHEKNKKSITAGLKNLVRKKDSSSSIKLEGTATLP